MGKNILIRMGFIVNPIAGMGGIVGLKGTDGNAYRLALKRKAKPIAWHRALEFLEHINVENFTIHVANGKMGYNVVIKSKHRDKITKIYGSWKEETTAEDTKEIAREMLDNGIDILVFVGGDGTARDIYEAVDQKVIVLGVPSGVKIYSAVFAVSPRAAAIIFNKYVNGEVEITEREILDIDEEAFRRDQLKIRLYGYFKVPVIKEYIQTSKSPSLIYGEEEENKKAIARYIIENLEPNTLYILGPGTTVKTISKLLGLPATILGVDLLYNNKIIVRDAWEKQILEAIKRYRRAKIIVSPIGGQGFVFGRGNQQISPKVIRHVGRNNIIIIATWRKIRELDILRIDTGDPELDKELEGYYRVLVDYNRYVVKKIVSG